MSEIRMNSNGGAENTAPPRKTGKISTEDLVFKVAPFRHGDVEYSEVDLRGIRDLTALQLENIEDTLMNEGKGTQNIWSSLRGATLIAAAANGMPMDWLDNMKAKDAITVRNAVFAFFIGLV